jgi:hypothetical protein
LPELLGLPVPLGLLGRPEPLAFLDTKESLASPVTEVPQEPPEFPGSPGRLGLLASPVLPEKLELLGFPVIKASPVFPDMEDLLERPASLDIRALLVFLDLLGKLELRVFRATKV